MSAAEAADEQAETVHEALEAARHIFAGLSVNDRVTSLRELVTDLEATAGVETRKLN